MKRFLSIFISVLLIAVACMGCGPKAPSMPILKAQSAFSHEPKDGFDRLIICRPWKFINSGVVSAFLINDIPAVNFKSGCARFDVKRGKHFVIACITDYDRSKWGKGIEVETKKNKPTIVVFDGASRSYKEVPEFQFEDMTFFQPDNPTILTNYISEDDKKISVEHERTKTQELAEIEGYKISIDAYISKKDFSGLKVFVNKNPRASYYIPDNQIRLLFIGPEKLQVGDIINYKKKKISDLLLVSKIKSSKTPYKLFSMDEIMMLQEYNISDALIAAMIDVTTEIEKEMARDEKQRAYLEAQRAFMDQRQSDAASNSNNPTAAEDLGKQLSHEVGKQVIKGLLNNIF